MFIILINYTKPIEEVNAVVAEHRAYLDTLYEKDKLICSGRRSTLTGGVLLSHAKRREEIAELIKNDPYNLKRVEEYKVIELIPGQHIEKFKDFEE